ncbi:MAG: BCCT family transporter, partial [Brachybacterium paraconglomeratum]|nr:BCCT family transporter [Brachybacterium paraconglomeratum]
MSSSGHGQGAEVPAQGPDISAWPEELPRTVNLPRSQQIATDDSDDEITEKLRRQGARISKGTIAPAVFWPAMVVVLGVALLAIVFPETSGSVMEKSQNWIVANLGWFYMLAI